MKTISILDFSQKAVALKPGAELRFHVTYEDGGKMDYFVTMVEHGETFCLLANCQGGGDPLVLDVTSYDTDLKKLSKALDEYINGRSGVFGCVDFDDENTAANKEAGRYMLISVCERGITTSQFPSLEEAFITMEKELEETMSQDREEYAEGSHYEIDQYSAWSNANQNAKADWLIVNLD